jgi:hypothetical protein
LTFLVLIGCALMIAAIVGIVWAISYNRRPPSS